MIVARNDGIERVAEAILNVIILIFTILSTLLNVVWMLVLAVHRSVEGFDGTQAHRTYLLPPCIDVYSYVVQGANGIMASIRAPGELLYFASLSSNSSFSSGL
jgi:hypothetical protein